MMILSNITAYFRQSNEMQMAQQVLGVDKLFKGFIVKDWLGDTETKKFQRWNKIIIKECSNFYFKC
jgi:hypothetical protein